MLQATLTLHTVWSIGVPIAIMEAFDPTPRQPWLGKIGLAATACIFVGASAALTIYQAQEFHFVASALQLGITAVVILACIIAAFLVRPQKRKPRQKDAPTSRIVMLTSFVLTSVYWLESTFLPDNEAVQWAGVAWWFVLVVASLYMYYRWSHCRNWNDSHRLAVAGGALLTYVWVGFEHGRYLEVSKTAVLTGNIIFGIAAITLLYLAMRRRRLMAITASTH